MPAPRPPLTARDDTGADWRRTTHLRQALTLAGALDGRTVPEAAELAGLPLATAYRALAALKAAGSELVHVERDDAGRYRGRVRVAVEPPRALPPPAMAAPVRDVPAFIAPERVKTTRRMTVSGVQELARWTVLRRAETPAAEWPEVLRLAALGSLLPYQRHRVTRAAEVRVRSRVEPLTVGEVLEPAWWPHAAWCELVGRARELGLDPVWE